MEEGLQSSIKNLPLILMNVLTVKIDKKSTQNLYKLIIMQERHFKIFFSVIVN